KQNLQDLPNEEISVILQSERISAQISIGIRSNESIFLNTSNLKNAGVHICAIFWLQVISLYWQDRNLTTSSQFNNDHPRPQSPSYQELPIQGLDDKGNLNFTG